MSERSADQALDQNLKRQPTYRTAISAASLPVKLRPAADRVDQFLRDQIRWSRHPAGLTQISSLQPLLSEISEFEIGGINIIHTEVEFVALINALIALGFPPCHLCPGSLISVVVLLFLNRGGRIGRFGRLDCDKFLNTLQKS